MGKHRMKIYQAVAPDRGAFAEVPVPVPEGDQVLVQVHYCGVCGTDYALFSGNSSFVEQGQATYPIRLGHEWSGVVAKVGPAVQGLQPGDRVVGDNYVSCGVCPACLRQDYNFCTGRHHVGTINPCWPGAFAEYFLVPQRHVYKIADHLSLKDAALCEPLSVAYGGIRKMNITSDSVVVVVGTGCIGMAAAALARYRGAHQVYMVGRNPYKLSVAEKIGVTGVIRSDINDPETRLLALTGGRHADYILECSGNRGVMPAVLAMAAQKATVAVIGFYEQSLDGFAVDTLVSKELTFIGIMGEYGNLEAVSKIMAESDLKMSAAITELVDFSRCDAAFHPKDHSRIVKTVICMPAAGEDTAAGENTAADETATAAPGNKPAEKENAI